MRARACVSAGVLCYTYRLGQVQRARLSLSPSRRAVSLEGGWHSETQRETHRERDAQRERDSTSPPTPRVVVDSEALLQEYRQLEQQQQRRHEAVLSSSSSSSCKDAAAKPQLGRSHRESIAALRAMQKAYTSVGGSADAGAGDRRGSASATAPSTPDVAAAPANTESRTQAEGAEVRLQVLSFCSYRSAAACDPAE